MTKSTSYALESIKSTLDNYFEGFLQANPVSLALAFHPEARLHGLGETDLDVTELSDWLESVKKRNLSGDVRQGEVAIESLEIFDDVATARVKIVLKNKTFTDFLSLILIGGTWKIVSKTYSVIES